MENTNLVEAGGTGLARVAAPEIGEPESAVVAALDGGLAEVEAPADCEAVAPVDAELVAVVPWPRPFSLRELIEALRNHRVLIVRLGGVPVAGLVAFFGALLIHAVFIGLFFAVPFVGPSVLSWISGRPAAGHDVWAAEPDEGGQGRGGWVTLGAGGLSGVDMAVGGGNLQAFAPSGNAGPPEVAVPVSARAIENDQAAALLAPPASVPLIGLPAAVGSWTGPRATMPPRQVAMAPGPVVAGPPTVAVVGPRTGVTSSSVPAVPSAVVGTGGNQGTGKIDRGGVSDGTGDEEGGTINLLGPGIGSGSGSGRGNGINRGVSGANVAEPTPIETPQPDLSLELQAKALGKRVVFELTVDPSGRVSDIKILNRSGVPDFDAAWQAAVARYKFRPAFHAGHAVTATYQVSCGERGGDE